MATRKLFALLGLMLIAILSADHAAAICKTCNGSQCYGLTSGTTVGASNCVSFQNPDGTWTCSLSPVECTPGSRGGGYNCTLVQLPDGWLCSGGSGDPWSANGAYLVCITGDNPNSCKIKF
jgi:hypothetical protein